MTIAAECQVPAPMEMTCQLFRAVMGSGFHLLLQSPWPNLPPLPLPHEKVAVRVTARTCWEPQETCVTNSSLKPVNREGPGK